MGPGQSAVVRLKNVAQNQTGILTRPGNRAIIDNEACMENIDKADSKATGFSRVSTGL